MTGATFAAAGVKAALWRCLLFRTHRTTRRVLIGLAVRETNIQAVYVSRTKQSMPLTKTVNGEV